MLLDCSGSVSASAWRDSLAQLQQLARGNSELLLWTFAGEIAGPFSLSNDSDLAQLNGQNLFGPTALYEALDFLTTTNAQQLVIASDGFDSNETERDWAALSGKLKQQYGQVTCLPLGADFNRQLLQQLGRVLGGGYFKLLDTADIAGQELGKEFRPSQDAWFDLPKSLTLDSPSPRLGLLKGAMPLLVDAQGDALLALSFSQPEISYGLNSSDPNILNQIVASLFAELNAPSFIRRGRWVSASGLASEWAVGNASVGFLDFEFVQQQQLRAGPFLESTNLLLRSPSKRVVELPGNTEFSGDCARWQQWFAAHQTAYEMHTNTKPVFSLVVLGLLFATASLFLRRYGV